MIPYMRRSKILEFMHEKDIVFFEELAEKVGVSLATVRRDLKTLEDEGHIEMLTGGAAKIRMTVAEKSLTEKLTLNADEKNQIGSYAATMVSDGQFIFIGPGTTENAMIKYLAGKNVTVVTNGAFHIQELMKYQINTIILGGNIRLDIGVVIGPTVLQQIDNMNFDRCFVGTSGVVPGGNITTSSIEVAEVNKVALRNATESYIVADSTKIGISSRYTFGKLDDSKELISTSKVDKKYHNDPRFIIADR